MAVYTGPGTNPIFFRSFPASKTFIRFSSVKYSEMAFFTLSSSVFPMA